MNLSFYKNKKVFITGHTGFKGSWLCKVLLFAGADVMGYSLKPEEESLYNLLNLDKKVKSVYADIRDYDKLFAAVKSFEPDIVIHMAAQAIVIEGYKRPKETFEINIMGTVNILEAIRNTSSVKSFLNVTTDKVYFNEEWNYGYRESDRLCGYDPYSNSKSCSELITYSYSKSFFTLDYPRISTARAGNVIAGGDFSKERIVPDIMRAYLKRENIFLRNPNSIRPYQHVLDCLNGYLLIIQSQYKNKKYAGNYNIGPDDENIITTKELATLFCKKLDNKINTSYKENTKYIESNLLKLDSSNIKNKLKYKQVWNINITASTIVEFIKAYENKEDLNLLIDKQIKKYLKDLKTAK